MLTDVQRQNLTRYFHLYDIDDDECIGVKDFERVIENVRILRNLSPKSLEYATLRDDLFRRWEALREGADTDEDGTIDLDEWLVYWEAVFSDEQHYISELNAIINRFFLIFDTNEDGVIGPDEFCDLYSVYGMSTALARQVFIELDEDGDGVMSHGELTDVARKFFQGDDPHSPANLLFGPHE